MPSSGRTVVEVQGPEQTRLAPTDAEIERAITSVSGVAEASLVRSSTSGPGRLRLRLLPGEDTESVSWAVAATLRERFGIALDPGAIRPVVEEADAASDAAGTRDAGSIDAGSAAADDAGTDGPAPDAGAATGAAEVPAPDPAPDPIRLVEPEPIDLEPPVSPVDRPIRLSDAAEAALAGLADRPPATRRVPGGEPRDRAPGVDATLWTPADEAREPDEAPATPRGSARSDGRPRIVISHLDTQRDDRDVRVIATLRCDERVAHGEATAIPTTHGLFRAVAEATLAAVRTLCAGSLLVGVDRVSVQQGAVPATATVVLSLLTRAGEETLVGSSLVRADADGAVMRATLDAINRRIVPFLEVPATA